MDCFKNQIYWFSSIKDAANTTQKQNFAFYYLQEIKKRFSDECSQAQIIGHEIDFYISHEPGSLMMSALKGRMSDTKIRVKAISLGEFISGKDIDFMKMDIEGSEGKVLMDIVRRGQLSHIKELIMEYHNNISDNTIPLSKILELLETQFKYQVDATSIPIYSKNKFQDVLVLAFKNENMPQT